MSRRHVIRYTYAGTSGGLPVGDVYVLHCPQFGQDVYSYTYEPCEASTWPLDVAEQLAARMPWPGATVLPLVDAVRLPRPGDVPIRLGEEPEEGDER